MKTLHLSILVSSFVVALILSHTAFGIDPVNHSTLEKQFGNITTTKLFHGDSVLILNQTTQKLVYKMGENITINAQLINMGNKTVEVAYCEPWVALEIKNQTGDEIWPNSQLVCIPEFYGTKTLHPGEYISIQPWGVTFAPYSFLQPKLSIPGNYTVTSVAILTFDMNPKNIRSVEPLWSEPLQITVLPEEYLQNETNSANQISSNVTRISNQTITQSQSIANPECVNKVMAQEHAQDVPIDNVRALDLATNYTQYKLKTLGHNYTLNRIYHDFSIDSCTAQLKDVIVEFTEKNSAGRSLITITEDLSLDKVKTMDISQVDELVTPVGSYMTPVEPQIDSYLIPFVILAIGSISVAVFFIFRIRKKT